MNWRYSHIPFIKHGFGYTLISTSSTAAPAPRLLIQASILHWRIGFTRDGGGCGGAKAQAALTAPLLDTTVGADPPFSLKKRVINIDSLSSCRLPRNSQIPAFDLSTAQEGTSCLPCRLALPSAGTWLWQLLPTGLSSSLPYGQQPAASGSSLSGDTLSQRLL